MEGNNKNERVASPMGGHNKKDRIASPWEVKTKMTELLPLQECQFTVGHQIEVTSKDHNFYEFNA